ncbi:nucleolin isoform X1 [Episyrphus balteatus]|uniref:nucleolin isoform X1 n=2 Tax=Episyrphus balteatus TaxID=286459 RepID=UPI0024852732|nr:nucleolin isoform X1 [Episyrphus balteatus]
MLFCFGQANGQSREAQKLFTKKYSKRRCPNHIFFSRIDHCLRNYGVMNHPDLYAESLIPKESKMADTEVKRKGRPKKRESEAVESPAKSPPKKAAVSNGDDAAVPAKRGRGRPPKGTTKASKKPPPVPGRGRGRPPSKPAAAASKKKDTSEEEDEEDEEEDEEKKESSGEADSS